MTGASAFALLAETFRALVVIFHKPQDRVLRKILFLRRGLCFYFRGLLRNGLPRRVVRYGRGGRLLRGGRGRGGRAK